MALDATEGITMRELLERCCVAALVALQVVVLVAPALVALQVVVLIALDAFMPTVPWCCELRDWLRLGYMLGAGNLIIGVYVVGIYFLVRLILAKLA